jgi:hypothetical protein
MLFCERERRKLQRSAMADLELVLVVGGSGYLGLHILHSLASSASRFRIAFTYFSDPPPPLSPDLCPAQGFKVDLRSGLGFSSISEQLGSVSIFYPGMAMSLFRYALKELRKRFLRNDANIPSFCSQLHRPATYLLEKPCSEPQYIRQHKEKKPNQIIVGAFKMY